MGVLFLEGYHRQKVLIEALWLLVLNGSQQIFKPAKPTALIHYT